ncbi:nucleoside monophosphate kinase [Candidatus Collierbacteria bacterium]|nr:nucleoside monophosphate kinase [Candidatus Collierbacteria bacterium]
MNFIILGPQGSGKGTQAKLLAAKFGMTHLSSGELLRQEAESGSSKGNIIAKLLAEGNLLPFDTVLEVLQPALLNAKNGFILDGTPRNLAQAEHLDWFFKQSSLKLDRVILLDIQKEESLKRLSLRAKTENRSDDTPEAISRRLQAYQEQTLPVVDYYRRQGLLLSIDGTPSIETIFADITSKLSI